MFDQGTVTKMQGFENEVPTGIFEKFKVDCNLDLASCSSAMLVSAGHPENEVRTKFCGPTPLIYEMVGALMDACMVQFGPPMAVALHARIMNYVREESSAREESESASKH